MCFLKGLLAVTGRVLLSTIFLAAAVGNKIPHFDDVAKIMSNAGIPAPEFMLVGAIAFLLVGSISVVLGFKARFGAALLGVFLVLASYYFHNFWAISDPVQQQAQMIHFMKNLSMFGAMVFIMANGAGPASVDNWL